MRTFIYQSGSTLIIALVILMVLTMLGVTGASTNILQQRMAGNTQTKQEAMQAAEMALLDARQYISSSVNAATAFTADCTSGLCEQSTSGKAWENANIDWQAGTNTRAISTTLPNVNASYQPRYIIEKLTDPLQGQSLVMGSQKTVDQYRITAVGFSKQGVINVMLQSTFLTEAK